MERRWAQVQPSYKIPTFKSETKILWSYRYLFLRWIRSFRDHSEPRDHPNILNFGCRNRNSRLNIQLFIIFEKTDSGVGKCPRQVISYGLQCVSDERCICVQSESTNSALKKKNEDIRFTPFRLMLRGWRKKGP